MMVLDCLSDLQQDCESTTHQLCNCLENTKTDEDRADWYDDLSVTYENQTSIIFQVKQDDEQVESSILRSPSSSENYLIQHESTASSEARMNKMNSSLGQGSEDNNDGFQTPTKFDTISSTGLTCPPAPRKPKTAPLRKRKRLCRNLQIEFVNEVELVLRLLSNENPVVKKVRPGA